MATQNLQNHGAIQNPGPIQIGVEAELHTKEAKNLFYGREAEAENGINGLIVGVNAFAQKVRIIVSSSKKDDPYADYFLLRAEAAFLDTEKELKVISQTITKKVNTKKISIQSQSKKPIKIITKYSTVYGNMAMQLLIKADEVFMAIHAAKHTSVLTRDEANRLLGETKKAIRRTLLSTQGFKHTNINRSDLDLSTKVAQTAKVKMENALARFGDSSLPDCVIDRTCRPKYAPNIILKQVADMNELYNAGTNNKDADKVSTDNTNTNKASSGSE